jgi:hypothetical protein
VGFCRLICITVKAPTRIRAKTTIIVYIFFIYLNTASY